LVCIRTDIEEMLLLSLFTVGLIPLGLLASALGYLPISFFESFCGVIVGGGILWLTRTIFWLIRKQEGLGWGDIELLAGIGSFVGPVGVLLTLLIGSISGSLIGLIILAWSKKDSPLKIPFGAFLAGSAIIYLIWAQELVSLLYIGIS
jgi:leader peptidase (prepilin peptidase)/N-methyltransferase